MLAGANDDATIRELADLFANHPAWREAAAGIAPVSRSNVYFSHRPGEVWHLEPAASHSRKAGSALVPGATADPDFVFRFSPGAVRRLGAVHGGIGAFAAELFARLDERDPAERVELRVVAPFGRLASRGYLRLLLDAGPKAAAFAIRHGVFGVAGLKRFVARARRTEPFDWEWHAET